MMSVFQALRSLLVSNSGDAGARDAKNLNARQGRASCISRNIDRDAAVPTLVADAPLFCTRDTSCQRNIGERDRPITRAISGFGFSINSRERPWRTRVQR